MVLTHVDPQVLLTALAGSSGEGEAFSLMQVHPGTLIWTLIIFGLLMAIMGKLVWKPILKMVHEREGKIREALEKADQAKAGAEEAIAGQRALADKQRQEAANFLTKAKDEAQRAGEEIMEKSRREATELTERARRQIEEEKNRAIEEVRSQAVDLAITAASHLLGKTLDSESHRAIVQDYIDQLPGHLSSHP